MSLYTVDTTNKKNGTKVNEQLLTERYVYKISLLMFN